MWRVKQLTWREELMWGAHTQEAALLEELLTQESSPFLFHTSLLCVHYL